MGAQRSLEAGERDEPRGEADRPAAAEEPLHDRASLYASLVESTTDFMFVIDRSDRIAYVNRASAGALGDEPAALIGRRRAEVFGGEPGERQMQNLQLVFRTGSPLYIEDRTAFPTGTMWLDSWLIPLKDPDGEVHAVLGVSRDVTSRKLIELELQDRVKLDGLVTSILRRFIELTSDRTDEAVLDALKQIGDSLGLDRVCVRLLADEGGRLHSIFEWDVARGTRLFKEEVAIQGFPYSTRLLLQGHSVVVSELQELPPEGEQERREMTSKGIRSFMFVPLGGTGSIGGVLCLECRAREMRWPPYYEPVVRVLAEVLATALARRKAEQSIALMADELLKIQKLESVGILAGGIAHDFNNILSAIWGNLSMARTRSTMEGASEFIEEAEKGVERARELSQQLLTFATGGAPVKRTAELSRLLNQAVRFAVRGSNARCEVSLAPELWSVDVDEGQISQVIQNLTLNAIQAMPQGGTVTVSAENALIDATAGLPLATGRYVVVRVRDQGVGIPPENLPKVFLPYFTTRRGGVGLGLATSHSIVRRHGGHMAVSSVIGEGTAFSVWLPASACEAIADTRKQEDGLAGAGRILVVDDEEAIRKCAVAMLEHLGYSCECAADVAEALELIERARKGKRPFDLVITDLTIPGGGGGCELLEKLRLQDPELPVIASSGYSNDPVMSDHERFGFQGIVRKPYGLEQLGFEVRRVLPSGRGAVT